MNDNVMRAILAMDSYNRSYGQGINGISDSSMVGNASVIKDSSIFEIDDQRIDVTVGFYAIAYEWTDSTALKNTVISYRGTNTDLSIATLEQFYNSPLFLDALSGWTLGAGFSSAGQAGLALAFAEDVFASEVDENGDIIVNGTNGVVLGHSLGGGLAGFVSSNAFIGENLTGYGYDHMPFGIAAWSQAIADAFEAAADSLLLDPSIISNILNGTPSLSDLIDGVLSVQDFITAFSAEIVDRSPQFDNFFGTHVEGEALTYIRDGTAQVVIGGVTGTLASFFGQPGLGFLIEAAGLALGVGTAALEALLPAQTELDNFGIFDTLDGAVTKHSMALLTVLEYGKSQWATEQLGDFDPDAWMSAAQDVLPAIIDTEIANSLGLVKDVTGTYDAGSQLATMIAYSAIDEGTAPFGDTGIRALFNDASDLGYALDNGSTADSFLAAQTQIGRFAAEYAGLLASNSVMQATDATATDGVLSIAGEKRRVAETLQLDLSDTQWSYGNRTATDIVTRDDLISSFLNADDNGPAQLTKIEAWYAENVSTGNSSITTDVDRISVALSSGKELAVQEGSGVLLKVLTDFGNKTVATAGTDFVIGGQAADKIEGGAGADILVGGGGDDDLRGGNGKDYLAGGAGFDVLRGGVGKDTLVFNGNEGVAIGGRGNDIIDTSQSNGRVEIRYFLGDGSDQVVGLDTGFDFSSLDFDTIDTTPIPVTSNAWFNFKDMSLNDVEIRWDANLLDTRNISGDVWEVFEGEMSVYSKSGQELMDLGRIAGSVLKLGYDVHYFSNLPFIQFTDGIFDASNDGIPSADFIFI